MDETERQLLRNSWRLDALDKWRAQIEHRVGDLETQVSELVKSDEIADAVALRVNQDKRLHLTSKQQRWAWTFGAFTAMGSLSGLVAVVGQAVGLW